MPSNLALLDLGIWYEGLPLLGLGADVFPLTALRCVQRAEMFRAEHAVCARKLEESWDSGAPEGARGKEETRRLDGDCPLPLKFESCI